MALDRKWRCNVDHYGGGVGVLTITAPGEELLPWDCEGLNEHPGEKCSGPNGCRVEWIYATIWNATAQARMSRLFEAASLAADRYVRRLYGGKVLPRQIGNVRVPQQRGVHHFHYAMPNATEVERVWSRTVRKFIEAAHKRELREFTPEQRWSALWREYVGEGPTRGIYGFGFSHPGRAGRTSERAARYMAKNAAGYLGGNASGGSRHYVSSRLTRATGVTMAALRACNYLYVRRKLIAAGELVDEWVPTHWPAEWSAEVLRVWALVAAPGAP